MFTYAGSNEVVPKQTPPLVQAQSIMEYFKDHGHENYVPNIPDVVVCKQEQYEETFMEHEEEESQEYRILDISQSAHSFRPIQEDSLNDYQDQEESDDNYDDDDEDRGVLKHTWADEDPNELSDREDETNTEQKALMSSLIKFINFLNKLLEDNQNFINSDIKNRQSIDELKQAVAINAHMIADLAKTNLESNYAQVNEIIPELKKLLAVKVDIFDKLYDRLVNGFVPSEVVKRLFSGNNLLVKTQIEELRRILFAKLELVNRTHAANVQRLKAIKRAKRKEAKPKVVQVFQRKPPKRAKVRTYSRKVQKYVHTRKLENCTAQPNVGKIDNLETQSKIIKIDNFETHSKVGINDNFETQSKNEKNGNLETQLKDRKIDNLVKRSKIVDTLEEKVNTTLLTIQKNKAILQDQINQLNKLQDIEIDKLIKIEIPDREESESEEQNNETDESLALRDFDSFTQVVSKKLNLKPEEASPSSILSKFRNNLNKKLQKEGEKSYLQNGTNVSIIEVNLDDLKEEDFIVEEVYFEDINPEESAELESLVRSDNVPDISSYNMQDTYNINDITFTKVPSATDHVRSSGYDALPSNPSNILQNMNIEKTLLTDRQKALLQLQDKVKKNVTNRQKALLQLQDMVEKNVEKSKEKRKALKTHLQNRVAELEYKAKLAKDYLMDLDEKKMETKKTLKTLRKKKSPRKFSHGENWIPYILKKENDTLSYVQLETLEVKDLSKELESKVEPFDESLNEKLKSLFQNNNLKGNLKKRKLLNVDSDLSNFNVRQPKNNQISCSPTETDADVDNSANTIVLHKQKLCDVIRRIDSTNVDPPIKDKVDESVKKPMLKVVHDVTLPRNLNGKRESKKPILLPGGSSRLAFLRKTNPKTKHSWLERGDTKRKESKNKQPVEEFHKSDSKSKKLLDKLKQQIFEKLHQQNKARKQLDVRQEIERRLKKKKEKTRSHLS